MMSNGHTYNSSIVLFEKFNLLAHGFRHDLVADAGLNVVLNALRQACPSADEAGRAWDEIMSGARHHLLQCYDDRGRKKTYNYHQVIRVS